MNSFIERAKKLVESGDDINVLKSPGCTLLHWACDMGDMESIVYLIEHGADVNCPSTCLNTPFHFAVWNSETHIDIIKYLLDCGADKDAKNDAGETVVQRARRRNNDFVAQFIESYEPVPTKGVHLDD